MKISHRTLRSRRAAIGLAIAASALTASLALAGCTSAPSSSATKEVAGQQGGSVTVSGAWAKATDPADTSGHAMSGVFGTLENHGDEDLVIESVSSDVAGIVELHEVVGGVMRAIAGDVTIPAGGSLLLEPGANHIMLMELREGLAPGDEVDIELSLSDGSVAAFTALVKETSGANESYGDLAHGDSAQADLGHGEQDLGNDQSHSPDGHSHDAHG